MKTKDKIKKWCKDNKNELAFIVFNTGCMIFVGVYAFSKGVQVGRHVYYESCKQLFADNIKLQVKNEILWDNIVENNIELKVES